ncbi:MAG: hypothetical protein KA165_12955 [Saprospiraceae bacterium]|nr:hypothetical protein [Saprospiraceae bacterium]
MKSVTVDNSAGKNDVPLEITGLAKGMYLVQARDGKAVFGGKFVVE